MLGRILERLDTEAHNRYWHCGALCLAVDIYYGYGPDCAGWRDDWVARLLYRLLGDRDNG